MARRVFFSFHYQRDIWRVNVVRNSNVVRAVGESVAFYDSSLWEEAQKKGDAAIKRMIDQALEGTTVTCVLIGAETAERPYVRYEIERSFEIGNGVLGVHINDIEDRAGRRDVRGSSPFTWAEHFYRSFTIHDWATDRGYVNFGQWVETAYSGSDKASRERELKRKISGGWL